MPVNKRRTKKPYLKRTPRINDPEIRVIRKPIHRGLTINKKIKMSDWIIGRKA